MNYETVIGIEIHCELKTKTKMFSGAPVAFGAVANSCVNEIDLGHPGTLPCVNKEAVRLAIMAATALHCEIDPLVKFDRKNYYYSDLPKGFQITQQFHPIGTGGYVEIETETGSKQIRLERIHMEEDTAKQFHNEEGTLIDFNRAGTPLVEIVSKADIRSGKEAAAYVEKLRSILNYLNSIANVQKAVEYEVARQSEILSNGGTIVQETRRYDEAQKATVSMRKKEGNVDYKYFPEPNIPPIRLDEAWIKEIQSHLPELPDARKARYQREYGLNDYDADVLVASRELAQFFDAVCQYTKEYKMAANWTIVELSAALNKANLKASDSPCDPKHLADMIHMIKDATISSKQAKIVFEEIMKGKDQMSDSTELLKMIQEVLDNNPKSIEDFKNGKDRAIGFLVGQVMKASKGTANPAMTNQLIKEELAKR